MRQIVYLSQSTGCTVDDLTAILHQSRRNNGIDGISGLLWSDRAQYLQVLEGPEESVDLTFRRIFADPRHRDIDVLSDRPVETREFGDWAMAFRDSGEPAAMFDERLAALLAGASVEVRATFDGMIRSSEPNL